MNRNPFAGRPRLKKRRPYWDENWLRREYVDRGHSAYEIAVEQGCSEGNILYFLHKFGIDTRTVSECRAIKHWGNEGVDNPMYGKTGKDNPNWKGGCTPERQSVYASSRWKRTVSRVWKRDKAICQRCKKKARGKGRFHIHHIISFAEEAQRMNIDNLILLCPSCHHFVHSRQNIEREFLGEP